jgi:CheY-like chemotaxis protein
MAKTKIHIVIAEDDPLLMRLYQEAFVARGYEVEAFFNGEEAYDALGKMIEKPTLILSDVMMPKMDGLALLRKLKDTPELKDIPFVLATNLADKNYAEKGLALGAIAYLVKGELTPKEFVKKIEELIGTQTNAASRS